MSQDRPAKIVIAHADFNTRFLIEHALSSLEDQGVEFISTAESATAFNLIHREKPTLIFLDAALPPVDGVELCQALKTDPDLKEARVVLVAAATGEVNHPQAEQAGADFFLPHPFDPDELLNISAVFLGM